jgi:small subunit ribosomal protein S9
MPKTTSKTSKGPTYFWSIGRRKSAVAAVKLFLVDGDSTINKVAAKKYFASLLNPVHFETPLNLCDIKKYHFIGRVNGGGLESQSEALTLAIARSVVKADPSKAEGLRDAGLLTVDSRVRERRKVGTGGKARRAKQSPKR